MSKVLSEEAIAQYQRDGFYFPVRVMSAEEARGYRRELESYEAQAGGPIQSNRRHKVHLLFTWANELVRHPKVLDAVEDLIGPNIICWTTNFFIKEANDPGFVSWHQDSTYWGLEPPDVVTAWFAFTDAPLESGAMKFLPGSQKLDQIPHQDTFDENNLLTRGQEVAVDVDESKAVDVPLRIGEISLHHIRLIHGSSPNTTNDRRIGLAIRYIPTHVRQIKVRDSAMLVRGRDQYGNFDWEPEPKANLDEAAIAAHRDAVERQVTALYSGTDRTEMRA
jgi:hypothetical protein